MRPAPDGSMMARSRSPHTAMNTFLKTTATLASLLLLLGHTNAGAGEAAESSSKSAPGVVTKVAKAVERGASAAGRGIEHGVKAAAKGIERGAKATEKAVSRVTGKVSKSPASSPAATVDK